MPSANFHFFFSAIREFGNMFRHFNTHPGWKHPDRRFQTGCGRVSRNLIGRRFNGGSSRPKFVTLFYQIDEFSFCSVRISLFIVSNVPSGCLEFDDIVCFHPLDCFTRSATSSTAAGAGEHLVSDNDLVASDSFKGSKQEYHKSDVSLFKFIVVFWLNTDIQVFLPCCPHLFWNAHFWFYIINLC